MEKKHAVLDGNEAVADIAYKTNEVIAIYPITPSSPMGEWADEWAAAGRRNFWGGLPLIQEMQSEGGAAGAIHGALQRGALATTFTASQGLLLMIPNMYKIAGELTPTVFHVAARSLASHALSIFCDHGDVMATRGTGFALLASGSVQEAMDLALVAQSATLKSRIPFLHFFDGFRTSHELTGVETIEDEVIRRMVPEELILAHRARALSPDRPVVRGTAQNPDVFFQSREAVNPFYEACPAIVRQTLEELACLTGRSYQLFDYHGSPQAERVIILMGSGGETVHEVVDHLLARGEKVGVLKVHLYRPFSITHFLEALPTSARTLAVLDRTKEPGSAGEPLYLDVVGALAEGAATGKLGRPPRVLGGRYGLGSKEFTPAMVLAVFEEMSRRAPKAHFTVGIQDDVSRASLEYDPSFDTESKEGMRAIFFGLGADGTVGANKNTIKIIEKSTDSFVQGFFVYDSKKAGSITVSHLRFGPRPIRSAYLIQQADFVACHQFGLLNRQDLLQAAGPGATFLLNSPYGPGQVWKALPAPLQRAILEKKLRFFVIDAYRIAREAALGNRINTIMQTCFFALSQLLPREQALEAIKASIRETYGKRGEEVLRRNYKAVDEALLHLHEVVVSEDAPVNPEPAPLVPESAPEFVRRVTGPLIAGRGDELPVSVFPPDGTYPVGTARWEKRNLAQEIPVWETDLCIQCGKCAMVCPHAAIRIKVYGTEHREAAPPTFKSVEARDREFKGLQYTIQVAPEDCTGCTLCVDFCPVEDKSDAARKALNMKPQAPLREAERANWDFFLKLPELDRSRINPRRVREAQIYEPLFEFSGACSGCGETPYLKLLTQLFGDRVLIANATGCSSIFGGNLPTTPWACNREGRGPAWSNSLFEDNAEFGLGFRLALDQQVEQASGLLREMREEIAPELVDEILQGDQSDEAGIHSQRQRVKLLKERLAELDLPWARRLLSLADLLVKNSVWIVGGDGWAYDIGFGGLDHVLASGRNVKVLVLDTEVYSNTGGQTSKATPRGAVARFSAAGNPRPKKDLARMMMTYGNVYVASVAMGARDEHTLHAFLEAESYDGPALIIAYSHCIAHGIDMSAGLRDQKAAVLSGYWPLFRYDPRRARQGKNPLQLDSRAPRAPFADFASLENRFTVLSRTQPEETRRLQELGQRDIDERRRIYQHLASMPYGEEGRRKDTGKIEDSPTVSEGPPETAEEEPAVPAKVGC